MNKIVKIVWKNKVVAIVITVLVLAVWMPLVKSDPASYQSGRAGGVNTEYMNVTYLRAPTSAGSTIVVAAVDSYNYYHANYQCDGTADNVQLNQAISALNTSGGGTLQLLDGTFNISDNIFLQGTNNITIVGIGWGTKIVNTKVANGEGIFNTNETSISTTSITIKDLWIDGNSKGITGISLYNITGVVIDNVKITDVSSAIATTGYGIFIEDCTDVWVKNCYINSITQRDGIQFKGVYRGHIENCHVSNCTNYYGIDCHDSPTNNGSNIWILNNKIMDCDRGIDIANNHTHCIGNQIEDIEQSGIELYDDRSWIWICDNDLYDIDESGINAYDLTYSDDTSCRYFFITGNYINQSTGGAANKDGIFWDGHYAQIANNIIHGFSRDGIYMRGDWNNLHDNFIFDCGNADIEDFGDDNTQHDNI